MPLVNQVAAARYLRIMLIAGFCLSFRIGWASESSPSDLRKDVLYGMRLEQVSEDNGHLRIRSTGCEFDLGQDGVVRCFQRIPRRRETLQVVVPADTMPFRLEEQNAFACRIESNGLTWTFQGDSVVIIKASKETTITFRGMFKPEYQAERDGRRMFIDEIGGFGTYPVAADGEHRSGLSQDAVDGGIHHETGGRTVAERLSSPRNPIPKREAEHIAHEGAPKLPYPSEKLIRSAARYCQVLVVHFLLLARRRPEAVVHSDVPPQGLRQVRSNARDGPPPRHETRSLFQPVLLQNTPRRSRATISSKR